MSQVTDNLENKNRILTLPSGKNVLLQYPVGEKLIFKNVIVTLLEIPHDIRMNENVFGIGNNGLILWQIEKKPSPYEKSPYLNLNRVGDNAKIGNWNGMEYIIEPQTGKILAEQYTK